VARLPYALTLWTYLQRDESERLDSLVREREQIRGADMTATAFHDPKKLVRFDQDWTSRAMDRTPLEPKTIEEISQHADDLWERHERGRKRPVS
jgi:hypothetical protein